MKPYKNYFWKQYRGAFGAPKTRSSKTIHMQARKNSTCKYNNDKS